MSNLHSEYPHINRAIDQLCQNASWEMTGASALIVDQNGDLLFELTKPKHWQKAPDGSAVIGIGAIGGSIEAGEDTIGCLRREVQEELASDIDLIVAPETFLVYEQRLVQRLMPIGQQLWPLLYTISANLYRQQELPGADILAIETYMVRLCDEPALGDLWGWLRVPTERIDDVLGRDVLLADDLGAMPDIEYLSRTPLPGHAHLKPVWTVHSLQVLAQASVKFA